MKVLAYYEFGLKYALIAAMAVVLITQYSDYVPLYWDWVQGRVPYGVLWVALNPFYWTRDLYQYLMFSVVVAQTLINWIFVRKGRMPKFMFYAGWLTSIIWMRTSVYQNVTVTAFAPLASVYPLLTVLLLLQKIPVGWSWNFSDAHWNCAFHGTQPYSDIGSQMGLQCSSPAVRWDLALPYVYSYMILAFWVVVPLVVYYWRRKKV